MDRQVRRSTWTRALSFAPPALVVAPHPGVLIGGASAYAGSQFMTPTYRTSARFSPSIRSRRERAFRGTLSDSAGRAHPSASRSLRIYVSSVGSGCGAERSAGTRPAEVLRGLSRKSGGANWSEPCPQDPLTRSAESAFWRTISRATFGGGHARQRPAAGRLARVTTDTSTPEGRLERKVTSITAWAVALGLILGLGVGLASQAEAEYSPPTGSVVLASTDTTPGLAEEITISARVQGQAGAATAGAACMFRITQQPGDDATVDDGPFFTDGAGQASTTLNSGTTEGTIIVEATRGEFSAQVSLLAGEPSPPPASLPDAGGRADLDGAGWAFWPLIATEVVIALGILVFAWRRVTE